MLGKIIENPDKLSRVKNENVKDCHDSSHEYYKYQPFVI
jgi:hypothetical protein